MHIKYGLKCRELFIRVGPFQSIYVFHWRTSFHYKIVIFDYFTKLFFYKTSVLIWKSYKKKLTVFIKNGARFKCRFGLAPSTVVTSFIEIELWQFKLIAQFIYGLQYIYNNFSERSSLYLKTRYKKKRSTAYFSAASRPRTVLLLYVESPDNPLQYCINTLKPSEHFKYGLKCREPFMKSRSLSLSR